MARKKGTPRKIQTSPSNNAHPSPEREVEEVEQNSETPASQQGDTPLDLTGTSLGNIPAQFPSTSNAQVCHIKTEIAASEGTSGRENQTDESNLSKESQNESQEQSQGITLEETGFQFEAMPIYKNSERNEESADEQQQAQEGGSKGSSGVQSLKRKRAQDPQEAKSDSNLKKGEKQTNYHRGYCAAKKCNKKVSNMHEHQFKRKHPRLQKCSMKGCRYFYPSWEERREHERNEHRERMKFRCAHCHYSTENKPHLKSHIKKHFRAPICSVQKTHACPHCDYFSIKMSDVKKHMNSSKHRNEERGDPTRKKFCCSKCEFSSFEITDVTNHIETHHPLEYLDDDD